MTGKDSGRNPFLESYRREEKKALIKKALIEKALILIKKSLIKKSTEEIIIQG